MHDPGSTISPLTPSCSRVALSTTAQRIAWGARDSPDATAVIEHGVRISYPSHHGPAACSPRAASGSPPGMLVAAESPRRHQHLLALLAGGVVGATVIAMPWGDRNKSGDACR